MARLVSHMMRGVAAAIIGMMALAQPVRAEPLPALGADLSRTSVSGLSSGAYMAGQFQVAYSKLVIGAGIVAGGPFGCAYTPGMELQPIWPVAAEVNLVRALNQCMADNGWIFSTIPSAAELLDRANSLARDGKIDPLDNLVSRKIYLFWGKNDTTVVRGVVKRAAEFFRKAGLPAGNIAFVKNGKAAHAFITEDTGLSCGTAGAPYLNDCDYDQAGAILTQIYGALQPAAVAAEAHFALFDQAPYAASLGDAGFSETGAVYIPASCRAHAGCGVHVVFHGCEQGRDTVGDKFVKGAGFARWAESNQLIILFPQVRPGTLNPKGCWDWWGFTGPHFLEREAPQMLAVRHMLDRLAAQP